MTELLLEIFSEEIPARMQRKAQADIAEIFKKELTLKNIAFDEVFSVSTPRRLTVVARGVPNVLPEVVEEKQGPRVGSDQKILDAFTKANGITPADLQQKTTAKGEYYVFNKTTPAQNTRDVLPAVIDTTIRALQWPKSMRWMGTSFRWPRPLLRILAVYDGKPLAGSFDLGGGYAVAFGDITSGHRFMSPETFAVASFDQYADELEKRHVVLTRDARKELIRTGVAALCAKEGLTLVEDDELLEEVVGLVEYPVILKGKFDDAFLNVPHEAITTSLKVNQRYFSTLQNGKLSSQFVFVSNMVTEDAGVTSIKGNEKVIRARLADAQFFWDQDIKVKLETRLDALKKVKFHDKLGSMYDKVERLEKLAGIMAETAAPQDVADAKRAARLAKADLTTALVFEFPELQGIVGSYCARRDGEGDVVADAIKTHYMPQGPKDGCPTGAVAALAALADKIDNLTGFFSVGEIPTSSKDPFALRRATLGAVRIALENKLDIDLFAAVKASADTYGTAYPDKVNEFIRDRIRYTFVEAGHHPTIVDAILGPADHAHVVRLQEEIRAFEAFTQSNDGAETISMANRVGKILASLKAGAAATIDPALMKLDEETALYKGLEKIAAAQNGQGYAQKLQNISQINPVLAQFFDKVLVNDNDAAVRDNRIGLLLHAQNLFHDLADFSCVAQDTAKPKK